MNGVFLQMCVISKRYKKASFYSTGMCFYQQGLASRMTEVGWQVVYSRRASNEKKNSHAGMRMAF